MDPHWCPCKALKHQPRLSFNDDGNCNCKVETTPKQEMLVFFLIDCQNYIPNGGIQQRQSSEVSNTSIDCQEQYDDYHERVKAVSQMIYPPVALHSKAVICKLRGTSAKNMSHREQLHEPSSAMAKPNQLQVWNTAVGNDLYASSNTLSLKLSEERRGMGMFGQHVEYISVMRSTFHRSND